MKIITIVDLHGSYSLVDELGKELSEADLVIIAGDLTNFGGEEEARKGIEAVRKYNKNILAVTGNCDTKEVAEYLTAEKLNIHAHNVTVNGVSLIGAEGSLPCPSPTPTIYSEDEYVGIFNKSIEGLDRTRPLILVSHQPPYDTVNDTLNNGDHVGSRSVRDFIESQQPLVCFSGHIHEAPGIDEIGKTKIVNPGPLGTRSYAYLDLDDGINTLEIRKF
jgi:Icc-related predicted phosphoesterase